MIRKMIIDVRDICYVYLEKKRGEFYARTTYKFLTKLIFSGYYLALLFSFAIILNKIGYALPVKGMESILIPIILLILYNVILDQLLKKTSIYPIRIDMGIDKYNYLVRKTIKLMFIGIVLLVFLPWIFDRCIPELH